MKKLFYVSFVFVFFFLISSHLNAGVAVKISGLTSLSDDLVESELKFFDVDPSTTVDDMIENLFNDDRVELYKFSDITVKLCDSGGSVLKGDTLIGGLLGDGNEFVRLGVSNETMTEYFQKFEEFDF